MRCRGLGDRALIAKSPRILLRYTTVIDGTSVASRKLNYALGLLLSDRVRLRYASLNVRIAVVEKSRAP